MLDVQRCQQCQRLGAHGFLHDGQVAQLRTAQRLLQLGGQVLHAALAAAAAQRGIPRTSAGRSGFIR